MALEPLYDCSKIATHFCGGIVSPNRLNHPEGLFVDPADGAIWCGGEGGELYRIDPDGSKATEIGSSGGFALGLCMDSKRRIYMCDLHNRCVILFNDKGEILDRLYGEDEKFPLTIPNYPVLSKDERYLYVSNTIRNGGPGIWRFDLESGESELWMSESCFSANGLVLSPEGNSLYLVESHLPGVSKIPILENGQAGKKTLLLNLPNDEPDGLAISPDGDLWISIYNPSRIYCYSISEDQLRLIVQDDTTDWLNRSTNIAFREAGELFSANLGGWHITRLQLP